MLHLSKSFILYEICMFIDKLTSRSDMLLQDRILDLLPNFYKKCILPPLPGGTVTRVQVWEMPAVWILSLFYQHLV